MLQGLIWLAGGELERQWLCHTKMQPFYKAFKNSQYLFNILSTKMPLFIYYFEGSIGLWFDAFKLE